MQIIDLTHTITDFMPAFPGDLPLRLVQTHFVGKEGYSNFKLETGLHIGTHIDSTAHFLEHGNRINKITLDRLCGKAILIDARDRKLIDIDVLPEKDFPEDMIVVICTSHYKLYRQESYYYDYPIMSDELCDYFIMKKVKLLALDTPSPDKAPYDIHPKLFNAGILIAENLTNTEELLKIKEFSIYAIPLNIDADGSPARIFAQCE